MQNLRAWNLGVGLAHLAQAVLVVVLSNGFAIAVVADVQTGPPGTELVAERTFFEISFAWGIAVFLGLAAADHLLMATPGVVDWYERNLSRHINYARWVEYSISASVMVVLIAMLTGITNLYALTAIFAVNAAMILFGLLMERVNRPGEQVDWWPFAFGSMAGAVPWIAIAVAMAVASTEAEGVPGFVYWIFVSLFLLFNCFALNQAFQYRRQGRFADYLYGEKVYVGLSLVAKSALAWQVYAGTLAS
jgi:hypothetical protein